MIEMRGLRDLGLIACYEDYEALPYSVLQDARLVMEALQLMRERQAQEARHAFRR